jgi:hypothetical protein
VLQTEDRDQLRVALIRTGVCLDKIQIGWHRPVKSGWGKRAAGSPLGVHRSLNAIRGSLRVADHAFVSLNLPIAQRGWGQLLSRQTFGEFDACAFRVDKEGDLQADRRYFAVCRLELCAIRRKPFAEGF